jgi:polyisoprenoid-binding protein YceI
MQFPGFCVLHARGILDKAVCRAAGSLPYKIKTGGGGFAAALTPAAMRFAAVCFFCMRGLPFSKPRGSDAAICSRPAHSWIKFSVKASVALAGKFDSRDATLTFASPDVTTGVLQITIQADSVDTRSGMKNRKLMSKEFFDVENNPVIMFKSTKIARTGPNAFEVGGDFTIRGVSNPEKLTLFVSSHHPDSGEIEGKMIFDRKDYGMNKGILFIRIADHVEVNFKLKTNRAGGPPLHLKP